MSTANVKKLQTLTEQTQQQCIVNGFITKFSKDNLKTLKSYIRQTKGKTQIKVVIEPMGAALSHAGKKHIIAAVKQFNQTSNIGVPLVCAEKDDIHSIYYQGHGPSIMVYFDWRDGENNSLRYGEKQYVKLC